MSIQKFKAKPEDLSFLFCFKKALLDEIFRKGVTAYYVHTRAKIAQTTFYHIFKDPFSIPSILTLKKIATALELLPENLIKTARVEAEKLNFEAQMRAKTNNLPIEDILLDWYEQNVLKSFVELARKHKKKK